MLDQFERNEDQQQFLITIFNKLAERTASEPELFDGLELTVLSDMSQNGVFTISTVRGDGMQLCEQAMTTLLQGYVADRQPHEWKVRPPILN